MSEKVEKDLRKIKKLSEKSMAAMRSGVHFLEVFEGAVRSSKTVTSLLKFYGLILHSPDNVFLISGVTMGTVSKNCIDNEFGLIAISNNKFVKKVDSEHNHYLELKMPGGIIKKVYYCGADKKDSYTRIKGMSIGGWYADEVNEHHESFVTMAFSRSIAATEGWRFNIWTLNPDAPGHWIYTDYIDKFRDERHPGYRYHHFILDDNPALSEERKNELKREFTGVFFLRYILGLRVRAEGACYPSFDEKKHVISNLPKNIKWSQLGADIGGNNSATSYTNSGFFYNEDRELCVVVTRELYDKEQKDTKSILENWRVFVAAARSRREVCRLGRIDSAEQIMKRSMNNQKRALEVRDSLKLPIIDRVRIVDLLFSLDRLFIHESCVHLIDSFRSAVFADGPPGEPDTRLDDGSYNVDSLDSFEYSIEDQMKNLVPFFFESKSKSS